MRGARRLWGARILAFSWRARGRLGQESGAQVILCDEARAECQEHCVLLWRRNEPEVSELLASALDHSCSVQLPTYGDIAVPLAESQQVHGLRDDLLSSAGLQA